MKNKYTLSLFALATIAILGLSLVTAVPFNKGFHFSDELSDEEIAQMKEHREAMKTAIENEEYDTWKTLMQERIAKMQESLTEENFNKIVEKHSEMQEFKTDIKEARESGDREAVKELRQENPGFFHRMKHKFFGN